MIKFFRILRQNLFSGGKPTGYLKYAIGEIILVTIGILIAIQLNEWNQQRLERNQYTVVLQNLKEEFIRTKELLTEITSKYVTSIQANLQLMQMIASQDEPISEFQIDSLISKSMMQPPFFPLQPTLAELMNSGNIKTMPNNALKRKLYDWESTIKWFHFDYDLYINFNNTQFQPYINTNWSWKNIDIAEGSKQVQSRSKLTNNPMKIIQDLEFENLVDQNLFQANRLHRRLEGIDIMIDKLMVELEMHLQ
ncbi:MAG: hypothetical protein KDC57_04610 [Saprospiraceae bacterium]|nr:hypothetical protein [Saprospiraceae bacterium]